MKIAVNTRLLLKNKLEGIGWFTYESIKRIVLAHPEHQFYFIFDRPYSKEFIFAENVVPIVIGPPARHPVLFYLWFEFSIPKVLKKIKPDVFVSPDAYLSLSSNITDLIVIHDLNFEHYPEHLPWLVRKYYRFFTPRFARKATRIATVSQFSKHDICKKYNVDNKKVDVLYNGTNDKFRPISSKVKNSIKIQYTDGNDYFVFVGAFNPRKNLQNIFKAFDSYKSRCDSNLKFVVVGEKMYWSKEIKRSFENMKYKEDVIFTGRLDSAKLSEVVGSSVALVYASFFEGFGIPIIEAFAAEVPVITSNVTSMPEVAGDAAVLVDPNNVDEISDAMMKVSTNKEFALTLIEKGKKRKNDFSWDKTSENLWQSVLRTIEKPNQKILK